MEDTFTLTQEQADLARDYWGEHGRALFRDPLPGEKVYYIGWSDRQEQYVLLSEDDDEEDYYAAACDAYAGLISKIPTTFVAGGEVVGKIGTGFWDSYGNETTELTFSEEWLVTLLQLALDAAGCKICLRQQTSMFLSDLVYDHAERAHLEITAKGRFAPYQAMSIRREAREYAGDYHQRNGQLPFGKHTLPSGMVVIFPDSE